jgi:hypothetical protein
MTLEPLETAEGSEHAGCQQLNIFMENQVGQLLRLTRLLESEPIRIVGLAIEGKIDCAIVRLLVNDPDSASEICTAAGLAVAQSEVLVVDLPPGKRGIMTVCSALIAGEVNVNYAYTVWAGQARAAGLAIQVDDLSQGARVLALRGFRLLAQHEL